jgi:ATP-binding cassette subfamily A (ABC1) protein 3
MLQTLNYTNSYGSYYINQFDNVNKRYEFILYVNTLARNAPIIYADYMTKFIMNSAAGREIKINYTHDPFPIPSKLRKQGETRNSSNLVFFVSVAFALIPANFITLIIKERESNTKHLQIISGISLTSYWISNFIFELVKYYFIGGVNLLIIYAFGNFPYYLWLLYLLYGPAMVSFTYMFSLVFTTESTAQNVVILVNFLFSLVLILYFLIY